ncbi:MAG: hypothetical protein VB078_07625, partial [Clostridiaceae bacterium]|nr:hypothetical protein [Clostridiaceae bacterium]
EWILRKARLLAVVGLHQNTFKPHTGTKTSVLLIQKYTQDELTTIDNIKQKVAAACPDYEKQIGQILEKYKGVFDIEEDNIPESILEILLENFTEAEENTEIDAESEEDNGIEETDDLETKIEKANGTISTLRSELLQEKIKLENMQSDLEALQIKQQQEIDVISASWKDTKKALSAELKPIKDQQKIEIKTLKDSQKDRTKRIKATIKAIELAIPNAEYDLKKLTNRGKLELLLADVEMMASLKERWIDREVSKKLDYPIFMAVSEKGGKNNSGDYEYLLDEDGNSIEYDDGQPIINQDLVNFNLNSDDLKTASTLAENDLCIAEAFIQFAQKHHFEFWRES